MAARLRAARAGPQTGSAVGTGRILTVAGSPAAGRPEPAAGRPEPAAGRPEPAAAGTQGAARIACPCCGIGVMARVRRRGVLPVLAGLIRLGVRHARVRALVLR